MRDFTQNFIAWLVLVAIVLIISILGVRADDLEYEMRMDRIEAQVK